MTEASKSPSEVDAVFRWRFAEAEFDEAKWELRVRGEVCRIERKPLEVLATLLRYAGELVSKEDLLEAAWPGRIVVEGALTNAVGKLRKALGDAEQALLVTVPRVGYKLQCAVERTTVRRRRSSDTMSAAETISQQAKETQRFDSIHAQAMPLRQFPLRRRNTSWGTVASALLALAGVVFVVCAAVGLFNSMLDSRVALVLAIGAAGAAFVAIGARRLRLSRRQPGLAASRPAAFADAEAASSPETEIP